MALQGMVPDESLLEHADDCSQHTFTKCESHLDPYEGLVVVRMEWCGDCGAADYEVV